jgi:isocitrate dehydrogenase
VEAVEGGEMTKDLSLLVGGEAAQWQTTEEFLATLDRRLQQKMAG